MLWFIMAMLVYPDCRKRAQEEIDAVMGTDGTSMPGFAHMNVLPYCFALTKEVFRCVYSLAHSKCVKDWLKSFVLKLETSCTSWLPPLLR